MKIGITEHPNAFVGRLRNRRMSVIEREDDKGVIIEFETVEKTGVPLATHWHKRGLTVTGMGLSEEGARMLMELLMHRFNKKDKL